MTLFFAVQRPLFADFVSSAALRLRRFSMSAVSNELNYINGKRCESETSGGGEEMSAYNPATGEVLIRFRNCSSSQIDASVSAAAAAFKKWSSMSGFQRGGVLRKAATLIEDRLESIAQEEVRNQGKPIREARIDIQGCADLFNYYAGLASVVCGENIPLDGENFALTSREPLGVCVGIGAWNYPFQTMSWKVAPALATGNAFIYKPSPFTPFTAILLAELLKDAGVPDGTVNVLQGDGAVGRDLVLHAGVDKVSFTGSVPTGQAIMRTAAEKGLKPVSLELGGKSPLIIFEDSDMKNAVQGAMMANFLTQGQVCNNGTRVFVHKSIAHEFTKRVLERVNAIKIGDPTKDDTTMGAVINEPHLQKILAYVQSARNAGATVTGGKRITPSDPKLKGGFFMEPCVVTNTKDSMKVAREEIFGPVMCIFTFDSEEEVVRRANDSIYGLSAGVFTKDLNRAHRVTKALKAGAQFVNTYNATLPEVPFGGYKMSGFGRELGTAAIQAYTQVKSVIFETGDVPEFF